MCSNGESCIIEQLLVLSFNKMTMMQRIETIRKGRPKPALLNLIRQECKKTKTYERHFNIKYYETTKWLAGCANTKSLYCWPCLLFSSEKTAWVTTGQSDLRNLSNAIFRHERAQSHIKAGISFNKFVDNLQISNQGQPEELNLTSVPDHNEKVKKNRKVIKRLVEISCTLSKQSVDSHSGTGRDRSNFMEIVKLVSSYDFFFAHQLETSPLFGGLPERLRTQIIGAIADVVLDKIREEINASPYLALMLDETSEVANGSQLAVVFRYVKDEPKEHFYCFLDVSEDRTATGIATSVQNTLRDFASSGIKLIAQTFDGSTIKSRNFVHLQQEIQKRCPKAMFVHSYAHVLNLVLSQAVDFIKECNVFFVTLSGLASFFLRWPKGVQTLDTIVSQRSPYLSDTKWNYNGCLVQLVKRCRESLVELFTGIVESPGQWEKDAILSASGFLYQLNSFSFNFVLLVFSNIFALTGSLNDYLHTKKIDILSCIMKLEETKKIINKESLEFDAVYATVCDTVGVPEEQRKLPFENRKERNTTYRVIYAEIFETVSSQLENRFKWLKEVKFVQLLDSTRFPEYLKTFPENMLALLIATYGDSFDCSRLRHELAVIYSMPEYRDKSIVQIFDHIKRRNREILPELYKLVRLVLTIPITVCCADRTTSTLTRIMAFAKNATSETSEQLCRSALFTIERELLVETMSHHSFHDHVVDKFIIMNPSYQREFTSMK